MCVVCVCKCVCVCVILIGFTAVFVFRVEAGASGLEIDHLLAVYLRIFCHRLSMSHQYAPCVLIAGQTLLLQPNMNLELSLGSSVSSSV